MRAKKIAIAGALALVLTAAVAGCSPVGCSGAAIEPPSVYLDATAWLQANPGATARACLGDGECQALGAFPQQISAKAAVGEQSEFSVRVTGELNGATTLNLTQDVDIPVTTLQSACGPSASQRRSIALNALGELG